MTDIHRMLNSFYRFFLLWVLHIFIYVIYIIFDTFYACFGGFCVVSNMTL